MRTLTIDDGKESAECIKLLNSANIAFETQRSPYVSKDGPVFYTPNGVFKRLEGTKIYVAIFSKYPEKT